MNESTGRRIFHEDIFAEDNEKWSWTLGRPSNVTSNYDVHTSADKESSSSPSSEEAYKGESNYSLKRSFRKTGFSSASEGNAPDDISSSPGPSSSSIPHERLLPSIYDDDAQSGNPSGTFEKKDLAFQSTFKKDFGALQSKNFENSFLQSCLERPQRSPSYGKDLLEGHNSRQLSPVSQSSPKEGSRDKTRKSPPRQQSQRSRSKSRDIKYPSHLKSRSRSKERKSPKSESRRSRSRERYPERSGRSKGRSRSPRSKRSRSPRNRKSPSRDSRRRSHSRDVRRRSRSRSYDRHRRRSRRSSSRDRYRRRRYSRSRSRSYERSRGSSNRKPGSLPLSSSGGAMTPQMALQQTMAAMSAKAQAMTGIALPKYYNPAAVNPLKYAEQVQKRKLLWQTKEKEVEQPKSSVWDKLTFDQDQDGKMTAKFRKLMGIKSEGAPDGPEPEVKEEVLKKQAELFRDLDQQYEMARVTTHTQRGVGLGYSANALYPTVQK